MKNNSILDSKQFNLKMMLVLRVRNVHYQQINFSPANYDCDGGIQSSDTVRRNSIAVVTTPTPIMVCFVFLCFNYKLRGLQM